MKSPFASQCDFLEQPFAKCVQEVIEQAISQRLLYNNQLPDRYYEEFPQLLERKVAPVEKPKKEVVNVVLESRMADYIEQNCTALPKCYRPVDIESLLTEDTKLEMRKEAETMLSRLPTFFFPQRKDLVKIKLDSEQSQTKQRRPARCGCS